MTVARSESCGGAQRAGFAQAIASEWTKLRTVRSTGWTLVIMAGALVGTAALVAATGSLAPGETVLAGSLGNAAMGQVAAAAVGVLVVCGEYSSGTIRATFAACPRRLMVLAAKTLVVAAVVGAVALTAAACAYLLGSVMLAGRGHPPGQPMPAIVGIAASHAAVAVLGVALGTAVRNTAAAVTAATGILILPVLLRPIAGSVGPWIANASPVTALQKLAQSSDATAGALGSLPAWPTLLLVCGYSGGLLAASAWLLNTRDS